MRQGQQQNRRGRSRGGRKGQNPLTRAFESNGPDIKIRGTANHIAEKYMTLARDATSSGDLVMAENYLQHAEHYNRIILAAQVPSLDANGNARRRSEFEGGMQGEVASYEGDDDQGDDDGDDTYNDLPSFVQQPVVQQRPQHSADQPQPASFEPRFGNDGDANPPPQQRMRNEGRPNYEGRRQPSEHRNNDGRQQGNNRNFQQDRNRQPYVDRNAPDRTPRVDRNAQDRNAPDRSADNAASPPPPDANLDRNDRNNRRRRRPEHNGEPREARGPRPDYSRPDHMNGGDQPARLEPDHGVSHDMPVDQAPERRPSRHDTDDTSS